MNENNELMGTELDSEEIVVTIDDKNGNKYDATILTIFPAGRLERDYCAVLSHVADGEGQFPIQIFRCELTKQDGIEGMKLMNVKSDMEFEEARAVLLTLIAD